MDSTPYNPTLYKPLLSHYIREFINFSYNKLSCTDVRRNKMNDLIKLNELLSTMLQKYEADENYRIALDAI